MKGRGGWGNRGGTGGRNEGGPQGGRRSQDGHKGNGSQGAPRGDGPQGSGGSKGGPARQGGKPQGGRQGGPAQGGNKKSHGGPSQGGPHGGPRDRSQAAGPRERSQGGPRDRFDSQGSAPRSDRSHGAGPRQWSQDASPRSEWSQSAGPGGKSPGPKKSFRSGKPGFKGPGPGRPQGGSQGGKPGFKGPQAFKHSGPPPSKPALGQLMARYGVQLQGETLDKLWAYHQLLRKHNHDQDLTRLIGFDTIAQRHYADCMILHGMMNGRWPSPLVDVGSGAGFPGIMIKLMSPKTRLVLAEPRPRRVQFLEMVIRELGLKDISVFPHKVTSRSLTEPAAGVITRAFETVEKTLPRLGGCLPVGGQAIFMKGPKVAEELETWNNEEYRILRNHAYRIPHTTLDRVLLILERTKKPETASAAPDEDADFPEEDDDLVPPQDP